MAIKTSETNPSFSTDLLKEILRLENEIDRHLIEHTLHGRASYMATSERNVIDSIILNFQKEGWIVKIGYQSDYVFRLDFEDPDQTGGMVSPVSQPAQRPSSPSAMHFKKSVEILKVSSDT